MKQCDYAIAIFEGSASLEFFAYDCLSGSKCRDPQDITLNQLNRKSVGTVQFSSGGMSYAQKIVISRIRSYIGVIRIQAPILFLQKSHLTKPLPFRLENANKIFQIGSATLRERGDFRWDVRCRCAACTRRTEAIKTVGDEIFIWLDIIAACETRREIGVLVPGDAGYAVRRRAAVLWLKDEQQPNQQGRRQAREHR